MSFTRVFVRSENGRWRLPFAIADQLCGFRFTPAFHLVVLLCGFTRKIVVAVPYYRTRKLISGSQRVPNATRVQY